MCREAGRVGPRCAGSCGPTGMRFGFREWTQGNESAAAPCGSKGRSGTVATGADTERSRIGRSCVPEHIRNARRNQSGQGRPIPLTSDARARGRRGRPVTRATGGADRRRKPGQTKGAIDDRGSGLTSRGSRRGRSPAGRGELEDSWRLPAGDVYPMRQLRGLLPVGQRHGSHPQRAVCTDPCRRAR